MTLAASTCWSRRAIIKHTLHLCLYVSVLICFQLTSDTLSIGYRVQNFTATSQTEHPDLSNYVADHDLHHRPKRSPGSLFQVQDGGIHTFKRFPSTTYGPFWTTILYTLRCLNLVALPLMIFHFCGLVLYPAFPDPPSPPTVPVKIQDSDLRQRPFLCFRVVTRGTFPALVKRNLVRNMRTCLACPFLDHDGFVIQVVTDRPLNLLDGHHFGSTQPLQRYPKSVTDHEIKSLDDDVIQIPNIIQIDDDMVDGSGLLDDHSDKVRELVVPDDYRTPRGSLYKARALQFALEDINNFLGRYEDWIVHLDEETVLSPESVIGIWNFVSDGRRDFGQGLITYAHDGIVNWLTTLADTFRVADDMGKQRFQLKCFHAPLFNWKGSYVVTRAMAESIVTFDVGPHGSIAEDCYFGMAAIGLQQRSNSNNGQNPSPPLADALTSYHTLSREILHPKTLTQHPTSMLNFQFDFIEGEMWEKSPFTVCDFLKQRKRWLQGIYLVVHRCPEIPVWTAKLCLTLFVYAWILMPVIVIETVVINRLWPVPTPLSLQFLSSFITGTTVYMYVFGAIKSFGSRCWNPKREPNQDHKSTTGSKFLVDHVSEHVTKDVDLTLNEPQKPIPKRRLKRHKSRRLRRLVRALSRRLGLTWLSGTAGTICCFFPSCGPVAQSLESEAHRDRCTASLALIGCLKCGLCLVGALAVIPFNVVIEVIAVVWGLCGSKHKFYIVSKQIDHL